MDELTRSIQEEVPWCMLFVDDIVLIDETRDRVDARIQGSGDIDDDVTHRDRGCLDEMEACLGVLCDKKIPPRLKGKFY
ncbi:hypothetical protein H5410_013419 [Solanum commersonii]|uniref:Reverse transcriptase n=1 Tax=Solanum commersonii TaxID=4109 RepID=A0A9J6AV26_SOLCO|nr:hypothetical protein H5410_013419 [Solanum commersonii]